MACSKSSHKQSFTNDEIKCRIQNVCTKFVLGVEPDRLSDWLVQANIITSDQWQRIHNNNPTRQSRCRALLHHLLSIPHPTAFLVVRQALVEENHYLLAFIDNQEPGSGISSLSEIQFALQDTGKTEQQDENYANKNRVWEEDRDRLLKMQEEHDDQKRAWVEEKGRLLKMQNEHENQKRVWEADKEHLLKMQKDMETKLQLANIELEKERKLCSKEKEELLEQIQEIRHILVVKKLVHPYCAVFKGSKLMFTKHAEEVRSQKPFPPRKRNNVPSSEKGMLSISDRTIKVSNIPSDVNKETLEMVFESKCNSGGDTDNIVYDQQKGIALITFKDPEVAKTLIQKKGIVYRYDRLAITRYVEEPIERSKQDQASSVSSRMVDFSEIPSYMTTDILTMLLENSCSGDIESIDHNQEHGTAVVTFTDSVAADVLISEEILTYSRKHIFIARHVEKTNENIPKDKKKLPSSSNGTIFVSQIPRDLNEDYLMMIFEMKRYGGGPIEDLDFDREQGTAVITFEDSNVAASLLKEGMAEFNGQRMLITKHENQVADAGSDEDSFDSN